jgi:hypothetical protein
MTSTSIEKVAFAIALLLFFLVSSVFAQTSKGSISGTITDAKGAFIVGTAITATNHNTGEVRRATTGGLGQYRIDAVEPGIYSVAITKKGFAPMILDKVAVSGSVVTSANAKLTVGGETQTIVVEASSAAVQTESGELSQTISPSEIREVPNESLNPYALATTLPGVSTVTNGTYNFVNGVEYSSNGSRSRGNSFLVEGQDNNDAGIRGQGFQPENLDSIQEVTVLLNSTSAEFGNAGGAIANLIYKSGTNHFHGAVWDRLSNSALDANDHANVIAGIPKSSYRENFFGFNFGGPVKKDKLFFFTSYRFSASCRPSSLWTSVMWAHAASTSLPVPLPTHSFLMAID